MLVVIKFYPNLFLRILILEPKVSGQTHAYCILRQELIQIIEHKGLHIIFSCIITDKIEICSHSIWRITHGPCYHLKYKERNKVTIYLPFLSFYGKRWEWRKDEPPQDCRCETCPPECSGISNPRSHISQSASSGFDKKVFGSLSG